MFFRIMTEGCQKGYGFVQDYLGNIWFYGLVSDCEHFINDIEGSRQ